MKFVVAMFQHETNTFSSLKTPLEAFAKPAGFTDPPAGEQAIEAYGKADFAFAALFDAAQARGDEVVIPVVAYAEPSGHVLDSAFDEVARRICVAVSAGCDAVLPDGRLDIPSLLRAFQQFFRENSEIWLQGLPFKEAGPHLVLQAFLQRIVNGGGRINREYALGRKYTDLFLEWPLDEEKGFHGEVQKVVFELKILRNSLDKTISDGMVQVADYARRIGTEEAYLVIFDRDPDVDWETKIWEKSGFQNGDLQVGVWGC